MTNGTGQTQISLLTNLWQVKYSAGAPTAGTKAAFFLSTAECENATCDNWVKLTQLGALLGIKLQKTPGTIFYSFCAPY